MNQEALETNRSEGAERYRHERRFARRCILQYLYQADQQGDWGNLARNLPLLRKQVREDAESLEGIAFPRAWTFVEKVVRGVCERRGEIDALVSDCATNWTVARMSVIDRNVLRMTAYQVWFCDEVPDVAAIDEAVELAKEFGHSDSARFVNGVLDRLLRTKREAASPEGEARGTTTA